MKPDSLKYRKMFRYICENLDKNLNSPQCREIKKCLDGCPDCEAYLKSLKKTIILYRRYPMPGISLKALKRLRSI